MITEVKALNEIPVVMEAGVRRQRHWLKDRLVARRAIEEDPIGPTRDTLEEVIGQESD